MALYKTMRYAALVEFDGSQFCGWQIQSNSPSVQAAVEIALGHVADEKIRVHTAGRTDTGVHAVGLAIHFDTDKQRPAYNWLRGANTKLPKGVAIHWISPVDNEFHARFSANSRRYRYIINTRRTMLGLYSDLVSCYPMELDVSAMQNAAETLIGTHDFSAYRASACQSKNPVKTIHSLELSQSGDWIWLDICANGFLHHMVRNIVGVLLKIGAGERNESWVKEVLDSRDRAKGATTALPNGLYFVQAEYDAKFGLPDAISPPRFW